MTTTSEVFFDNVGIEESDLVGEEDNGFIQLMKNFEIERLLACAVCLGTCECAFEDAARYVTQREQFGQPIGEFQINQMKLTYMYIVLENMRNMVYRGVWLKDNGQSIKVHAAMCKRYCGEQGWWLVNEALQLHGGIGYTADARVSRLWRNCRVGTKKLYLCQFHVIC